MSIADKLTTIAENEQKVYDVGKTAGESIGYERGHTEGEQSAYDKFWDTYQLNGKRDYYQGAFAGGGWNAQTFKPKYPIKTRPTGGQFIFYYFNHDSFADDGLTYNPVMDFTEFSKMIDFSELNQASQIFRDARIKNLTVDFSNATIFSLTFFTGDGGWLNNLTIKVSEKCTNFSSAFAYTNMLTNLTFTEDSVIAATIQLQQSPLTVESMKSVIGALKNYAGTDKEGTCQVKFSDSCWAKLEADSIAPDGGTWQNYVISTLGWTI